MAFTEKYVSVAGGGAHDGSSEANAWTLEEAIAAPVGAGVRVNVKSGTYTLTAARTLPAGTSENPIEWRGYNSTIGDLLTIGRDASTGLLTDTNFPVIDCTASYRLTNGAYTSLKNLTITSAINEATLTNSAQSATTYRCKLINTHANGAAARAFSCTSIYGTGTDCDCVISSTSASASVVFLGRSNATGCRVWHAGSPNAGSTGINVDGIGSNCFGCVIHNIGVAIRLTGTSSAAVHNSWYNVTNGVLVNGDSGAVILGNVGWSHSGYGIIGTTSSGNPLIVGNALGSYTSGRIDTSTLGSIIEEIEGITLTADPFTNSGSGDFTLNNTSGGGVLCRAASTLWDGHRDLGAMQHQESSGGGAIGGGNLNGGFQ